MKSSKPRSKIRDVLITQSIAVVAFVLVPVAITLMAPITDLEFNRTESGVQAIVRRYVLIGFNWKTVVVPGVTDVRADITAEKRYTGTREERRKGQKGVRLATGQVALLNSGPEVIIQAAPELATEIAAKFDAFAGDGSTDDEANSLDGSSLKFRVYASWGLSYVLGGIATGFAALYVFGASMKILLFPFQLLRSGSAQTTNVN